MSDADGPTTSSRQPLTGRDDIVRSTTGPDDIVPDTKDWTWVLTRRCPDCGLVAGEVPRTELGPRTREASRRFAAIATRPSLAERPAPGTWSDLEYSCHVRDVCRIFDRRIHQMLDQDDPRFDNWDQDASALTSRYAEQDPSWVFAELREAAGQIAGTFDAVRADQWERAGRRSDGARFTVLSLGRYFLHDLFHHLHDVNA